MVQTDYEVAPDSLIAATLRAAELAYPSDEVRLDGSDFV